MAKPFQMVKSFLKNHRLIIQSVETGLLMGLGDFIAEKFIEKRKKDELDWARTAQFAAIGLFIAGPALTVWYRTLERMFKRTDTLVTVKKVLMDQLFFAPVFIVVVMMAVETLQGHKLQETIVLIKRDLFDIITVNYCVWPLVQMVNFSFVPVHHRVLVDQSFCVIWNTYLSWKINRQPEL